MRGTPPRSGRAHSMRGGQQRAIVIATTLVALTGCTSAREPSTAAPPIYTAGSTLPTPPVSTQASPARTSVTTPALNVLTVATLKRALLRASDLPPGWTQKRIQDDGSGQGIPQGACASSLRSFFEGKPQVQNQVSTAFERGLSDLSQKLLSYASAAMVQAELETFAQIVRSCKSLSVRTGNKTIALTVTPLNFPRLGDATFAFAATGQADGVPLRLTLVAVRVGRVLVQLTQFEALVTTKSFLPAAAQEAVARVMRDVPTTP